MICTAPFRYASTTCSNSTTTRFVANGTSVLDASSAIASIPRTGSSRYCRMSPMASQMLSAVGTRHAPMGSIRNGASGNASRNNCMVSISNAGSSTPPLSFSDLNPYCPISVFASSSKAFGVMTSPNKSSPT